MKPVCFIDVRYNKLYNNALFMKDIVINIFEILKVIPPREAILWISVGALNLLYLKSCSLAVRQLQKENQRLVEEKRDLWEKLEQKVERSTLDHYAKPKRKKEEAK